MKTSRVTAVLLSSLVSTGFGFAAATAADPAPNAQASCDALARAANDSAVNMDKIHSIAQTISPALPHPDNPELQTGNVNIIELFFKARDLSRSLRQSSAELRGAEASVELDDLRDSADNLAQVNDNAAGRFDEASNPLAPRGSTEDVAGGMFDVVKDSIQAFQGFNAIYSKHCDVDLTPDSMKADDSQPAAAPVVDADVDADEAPVVDVQSAPVDEQLPADDDN